MTDTITISLTREEAGEVIGSLQYPPISHNAADPPDEATLACPACSAVAKLRAALDRESETPTQTPRKSPEPGPTTNGPEGPQVENCHLADDSLAPGPPITEEQVERGGQYLADVLSGRGVLTGWYCGLARACLEAARDA